jgi:hypothetical protein
MVFMDIQSRIIHQKCFATPLASKKKCTKKLFVAAVPATANETEEYP